MRHMNKQRWMACFLACVMALLSLAPVAEARQRSRPRYKGGESGYSERYRRGPSRYVVRRSNSGAILAGFLGGVFLGAALANAAPAGYAYEDPYCGRRYRTLDSYYSHCNGHRHPREIRVVAVSASYDNGSYRDEGYGDGGYGPSCGPDREYRQVSERHRCGDCGEDYYGSYRDHARHCDHDE
jgi:hypothetical protein